MHASLNDVRILDSGCDPFPVAVTTGIFSCLQGKTITLHFPLLLAMGRGTRPNWIVYVILDCAYDDRLPAYLACLSMYQHEAYVSNQTWYASHHGTLNPLDVSVSGTLKLFDVEQTSNLTFVSPQFYWEKTTKARFNQSTFASSPVVPVPFAWDPAIQDGPHLWKPSVANTCSIARFTWFQKHVYVSCVCKDRINLYIYVYPWKGNLPTTHTEGILGYRNHSLKNLPSLKPWKGHVLASEGLTSQVCCKLRHVLQKGILLKRSFS